MEISLTKGNETKAILKFALPLILANIFQQLYNLVDSIIVGKYIGPNALAAVGSAFTLMVFLTSILLGLCMGTSVLFSRLYAAGEKDDFKNAVVSSFIFIAFITIILNILSLALIDPILGFMNIPDSIYSDMKNYSKVIFYGISFVFLYNFFSSIIRSVGNSIAPLIILIISALMNVVLDLLFVTQFNLGVVGAAWATIIAQLFSAIASAVYCLVKIEYLNGLFDNISFKKSMFKSIAQYSILTSIQQSVMNLGILLIQGLINSFGVTVMAGFAAAIKIEAFAYMPMQEYSNAFSTFVAQNIGAKKLERVANGVKSSAKTITAFAIFISILVFVFADKLMLIFLNKTEVDTMKVGVDYLKTVGVFYVLIGYLFSFYAYFRAVGKAQVSIILTIVSLGVRVLLAYTFAAGFGLNAIWYSIIIGWLLADLLAIVLLIKYPLSKFVYQENEVV